MMINHVVLDYDVGQCRIKPPDQTGQGQSDQNVAREPVRLSTGRGRSSLPVSPASHQVQDNLEAISAVHAARLIRRDPSRAFVALIQPVEVHTP